MSGSRRRDIPGDHCWKKGVYRCCEKARRNIFGLEPRDLWGGTHKPLVDATVCARRRLQHGGPRDLSPPCLAITSCPPVRPVNVLEAHAHPATSAQEDVAVAVLAE